MSKPTAYDLVRHGAHAPNERGYCNAGYVCGRWPCDVVDLQEALAASEAEVARLRKMLVEKGHTT